MISDKLKCIFIHTNKCAGESIEQAILGRVDTNYRGIPYFGSPQKHWNLRQYFRHHPLKTVRYFKFSVVRNPWDRVFSWTKFRDKWLERDTIKTTLQERMLYDFSHAEGFNIFTYEKMFYFPLKIIKVDYIMRFENLERDFEILCDKLNIERFKLPHLNKTEKIDYRKFYTQKLKALVEKRFQWDIEHFGYKF